MPWLPPQQDIEEWLDLGAGTAAQRRASLADLRRINRWLGGSAASGTELVRLAARAGLEELTLLDLGTGSADVPAALRVAGRAVLMNDLVRHRVPLLVLRAAMPVVARSPITRHDGIASLLRAYTPAELLEIARSVAGDRCAIRMHFPYRHCLVIEK